QPAAKPYLGGGMKDPRQKFRRKFHPVYLLLALPWVAHLLVPSYNRLDPRFLGIPFFYWWQSLWILLAALCILPVYLYEERRGK
ncbi:MAG TPA: DUF3311 domain-containing protein, partial [Rhizomicrobium sp.]|nr:DUF3311 domain-containing protein [Rhizomicrobium sp.]